VDTLLVAPDSLSAPLRARLSMDNLTLADLLPAAGLSEPKVLSRG